MCVCVYIYIYIYIYSSGKKLVKNKNKLTIEFLYKRDFIVFCVSVHGVYNGHGSLNWPCLSPS